MTQTDPATTATLAPYEIDPNAHQPYLDEFIVGRWKEIAKTLNAEQCAKFLQEYSHIAGLKSAVS